MQSTSFKSPTNRRTTTEPLEIGPHHMGGVVWRLHLPREQTHGRGIAIHGICSTEALARADAERSLGRLLAADARAQCAG